MAWRSSLFSPASLRSGRIAQAQAAFDRLGWADPDHSPWVIGGWYEAALEQSGDHFTVSALTLHPSWQTGSQEILTK
ncbi:MAG TPA: hypothetical protein VE864_04170 [Streptosporangiaceae bacterium]|nr:hypothetical protein [Streptosporangiaceae bacterium]